MARKSKVHTLKLTVRFDKPCTISFATREAKNCMVEGEYYPTSYHDSEPETMTVVQVTRGSRP